MNNDFQKIPKDEFVDLDVEEMREIIERTVSRNLIAMEKRAKDWIFSDGTLTSKQGKELLAYIFKPKQNEY